MASAILTSAKHGAYIAIGVYVAMVLAVSLATQSQRDIQAPVEAASPSTRFEYRAHSATLDSADVAQAVVL
ncbi:hypothetical protein C1886_25310 [Pseudomonas sp. FW300-N1A1]|uniref:hypothetical protein n=1 Tax=Pseudomonas sp. FW300-N1A1 TaxID=2075555 RepID=UPI000CD0135A|nr:hypothetical protein [Pseudomonas sp. FW300-N1A1]POA16794.1 hypothetical protein C1886_25310 [Pseudomonas sp. FW300-N1A1]